MNEDGATSQEPALKPESGDQPRAPLGAGPAPTVVETGGPSAGATVRRLGLSLTPRAVGVVGIATLVVVGLVLGSTLWTSSGASRGTAHIRTVLTSAHGAGAASGATITVTGNGQVEGTPDTATFGVGVSTTASTAVAALEQNNAQVAALESSLEQNGVEAKDMQTSWLNLSANTDSSGNVTGFSADDELTVTMTDLSDLGEALDAAVHATGNDVTLDGISFSVSNQSSLLAAARAQAMLAAQTEATQVAAGGGLALGPIVKVTDQENAGQNVYYPELFESATPTGNSGTAVPVQPGQQQISVQVTVVYQLVTPSS